MNIEGQSTASEAVANDARETRELLDEHERLWRATYGLRMIAPHLSAHNGMTLRQRKVVISLLFVVVLGFGLQPRVTGIVVISLTTFVYTAVIAVRLLLIVNSLDHDQQSSEATAFLIPDHELPFASVLVPAYKEPEILRDLLAALSELNYPEERLELLLVLEGDDEITISAARELLADDTLRLSKCLRIIEVPPAEPRTKPKALNYALQLAKGDLITIYDAEDRPHALQLRAAAVALANGGPDLACVQAQLNYFNPEQNMLTKWFTLEYTMWFTQFLPGLVKLGAPIPLGGTSNHFRREAITAVGGWDPFNVTEDADLGLRFHRMGYRIGVLDSVTLEEANSDAINWVKQRSRWYKGYLQTWLVNLRHPIRTTRTLGLLGFVVLNLFVGGTPLLALLNPLFWFMCLLWFTLQPQFVKDLFPVGVFYPAMACWVVGNFLYLYAFVLTAVKRSDVKLTRAAFAIPGYYVLMSLAAYKAFVQLIFTPTYWEKTQHGLGVTHAPTSPAAEAPLPPDVESPAPDDGLIIDLRDLPVVSR
jgi:cellulose synthase/poly-beta-1,6-N-acetylglucosamine synthase-like glycosyltransferase